MKPKVNEIDRLAMDAWNYQGALTPKKYNAFMRRRLRKLVREAIEFGESYRPSQPMNYGSRKLAKEWFGIGIKP